jgi:hypothetical protein
MVQLMFFIIPMSNPQLNIELKKVNLLNFLMQYIKLKLNAKIVVIAQRNLDVLACANVLDSSNMSILISITKICPIFKRPI